MASGEGEEKGLLIKKCRDGRTTGIGSAREQISRGGLVYGKVLRTRFGPKIL